MNGVFSKRTTPVISHPGDIHSTALDLTAFDAQKRPTSPTTLSVMLNIGAMTGQNTTLDVEVQWSNDNVTFISASVADAFPQIVSTGPFTGLRQFTVKARYARLKYVPFSTDGQPSFPVDATAYAS